MRYANETVTNGSVDFSEVIAALSYALDITEGQNRGHAARSCILGMRIAREIGLGTAESSALFYGLLLKDLGCSSNASKVCCLFGADDRATKFDLASSDFRSLTGSITAIARNVAPQGNLLQKASRFITVAAGGQKLAKQLIQMRCDRGATIARKLHLPEATAEAIRSLDEHWDGGGHHLGLSGEAIPLLARIMGLAQTAEVFFTKGGVDAACDVVAERSGTWFDPQLVAAMLSLRNDESFWAVMSRDDAAAQVVKLEPAGMILPGDDSALDRVAEAFGMVIDAKSPWTFCHSSGVADVSVGIAEVLGFQNHRLTTLRRAALLHDIGKLGVSNLILDKPGKLDADELKQMRRHPEFTFEILDRVRGFRDFAEMSAAHHERLDGRGYFRGISGEALSLEVRILGVADMYEALAAKRPYRKDLTQDEVMTVLLREAGTGLCPIVVSALQTFLAKSHFVPYQVAA